MSHTLFSRPLLLSSAFALSLVFMANSHAMKRDEEALSKAPISPRALLEKQREFFEYLHQDRHMVHENYVQALLKNAPLLPSEEGYHYLQTWAADARLDLGHRLSLALALPPEDQWRHDFLRTVTSDRTAGVFQRLQAAKALPEEDDVRNETLRFIAQDPMENGKTRADAALALPSEEKRTLLNDIARHYSVKPYTRIQISQHLSEEDRIPILEEIAQLKKPSLWTRRQAALALPEGNPVREKILNGPKS